MDETTRKIEPRSPTQFDSQAKTGQRVVLRWPDGMQCEGTVEDVMDQHDIFWITDHSSGTRRIVFASDLSSITEI